MVKAVKALKVKYVKVKVKHDIVTQLSDWLDPGIGLN
jgi:hypothetical protein